MMESARTEREAQYFEELNQVTHELCAIHSKTLQAEALFKCKLRNIHVQHQADARNLLHYLALRQHDLRPLQEKLARFGLSSLGRAESHVLAGLDAVLRVLRHLTGDDSSLAVWGCDDFRAGRRALEDNTRTLLGAKPASRDVRIMVTMPSEAATDYGLVRGLVDAGMDCMRINCAHDDESSWAGMVENLKRARAELDRSCRILMDLPGPKLRTGEIEPLPGVLKWRPRRDRYGRVVQPAEIWLTATENPSGPPKSAKACLCFSRDWLRDLKPEDTIRFTDSRGSRRLMRVKQISENGCLAECAKTAYVAEGTIFKLVSTKDRQRVHARPTQVEKLPREPQAIRLKVGDRLALTSQDVPGRPAVYDTDGTLIEPPTIRVTLPEIFRDVRAGEPIWFDDGKIGGIIRSVSPDQMIVEITVARPKGENLWADKGINLPESRLSLPALTDEDIAHLPFIVSHADLVGYSFVRTESDLILLQNELQRVGGQDLGIILKIETRQGFENLPDLLLCAMRGAAAGVMIARGDLAVECGYERVGELQEEIMWLAEAAHIPVIWATQVLEGLAKKGQRSRAEITDAAMAERAECVMLNKGPYVVEAVQVLDDILRRMQGHQTKKFSLMRRLNLAQKFCGVRSEPDQASVTKAETAVPV
ncbi:MAG TPA: pyruvate kinase [Candidatus Binatia bacterium]